MDQTDRWLNCTAISTSSITNPVMTTLKPVTSVFFHSQKEIMKFPPNNISESFLSAESQPELRIPCSSVSKCSNAVQSSDLRRVRRTFRNPFSKYVSVSCDKNVSKTQSSREFFGTSVNVFCCKTGQSKNFKYSYKLNTSNNLYKFKSIRLNLNHPFFHKNLSRKKHYMITNSKIQKKTSNLSFGTTKCPVDSESILSDSLNCNYSGGFPQILEADSLITTVEHNDRKSLKPEIYRKSSIRCESRLYKIRIDVQGGGITYPRTCEKCKAIFLSQASYSAHIEKKRCELRISQTQKSLEANPDDSILFVKDIDKYFPRSIGVKYPRTCHKCKATYSHKTSYFRHLKTKRCDQIIYQKKIAENPNYAHENPEPEILDKRPDLFVCPDCNTAYVSKRSLRKHRKKTCKNRKVSFIPCVHPGCEINFHLQLSMIRHLADAHGVDLQIQRKNFANYDHFLEWKKFEERRTFTMLTKRRGDYIQAGKKSQYYSCMFNVQERKTLPDRKYKHAHSKGNLVNTYCPARVDTLEGPDGVEVTYYSYHNHELNPENLRYCKWNDETKDLISKMIENKVPVSKIKAELSSNTMNSDIPVPLKEHYITARQIYRLKYDLSAKMKINKKDALSVQLLVNELVADKPDSILVFKPQGKPVELGEVPKEQLSAPYLFVLGIQQERQRVELINSCRKVLCINIEHFPKMYNFSLMSFFIQDEFSEGYPIAHFITNRLDSNTLTSLFSIFKANNPYFELNAFMTEDNHILYDAFLQVFDRKPIHLLCKMDVNASFLKQLNEKVENSELVAEMHSSLMAALEENDIETFKTMLSSFLSKYEEISPNFCKHFSSRYAKKAESWAMCFRNLPYAAADSSEFCKVFRRKIKFAYRLQKANRRMDDFINVILKTDRFFHLAVIYKRSTNEVPHIEGIESLSRHAEGLLISDESVTAVTVSKSKFKVKSDDKEDSYYTVSVLLDKCSVPTACYIQCHKSSCHPLCCHMYSCNCPDQNSLCKHIHKVHSLNKQNPNQPKSDKLNESDESDCELDFSTVLKKAAVPPPEMTEEQRLLAVAKKAVRELETRLANPKSAPLSHHINITLSSLASECDRLIHRPEMPKVVKMPTPVILKEPTVVIVKEPTPVTVKEPNAKTVQDNSCPPPSIPSYHHIDHAYTDLTGNKRSQKADPPQSSPVPKKTIKLDNVAKPQPAKVKQIRIPLKCYTQLDTVKNFSGSLKLSDSLFKTLFKLGPYNVKLYHLKSLDPDIPDEDLERIQIEVPGFKKGWLYDCVIYSFLTKIAQPHISVKVIDPCVSQLVLRSNGEPVPIESVAHFDRILIPCNPDESHWLLVVVYPAVKLIHFFDPQSTIVEPEYHKFIGFWAKTISKASGIPLKEWQMKSPKHTKQTDNLNCGVYVAWYADQILKNRTTFTSVDIPKFRRYMYECLRVGLVEEA